MLSKPTKPIKVISATFTAIIIFLSLPATVILASWNSLPGSPLYPVKRGLEKTALALLPNNFFEVQLRLKLIDRRTQEVASPLIQAANQNQAFSEIVTEAQAAQLAAANLKPEQQVQATAKLITTLNQVNQSLEEIKTTSPTTPSPAAVTPTQSSPSPQTQPTTTTQTATQSTSTSTNVTQTQTAIQAIITELESSPKSDHNQQSQQDKKDKKKDKKDDKKDKHSENNQND